MIGRDIQVGDIVSPGFYGPNAYGVVLDVSEPERRNVHSGFKPRAKILMHTGKVFYFILEDLTIVSKGNNHDTF
tara:strand:+ start:423 stop:644 length:222 start_codon:yes stop_codon:yes gene_type:complete